MSTSLIRRLGLELPAHRRVFAGFFLYAFGFGGFFPRLGELQGMMGVTEGQLGMGLIGAAMGTLVSLTFAGRLIERIGHRRMLLIVPPLLPVFYAVASHASGTLGLFLCLFPAGLFIGAIEVVVNLEADRVEHQEGRRIMNRAHAFWSFGFFGAGLLGALAARVGLSPQWQLAGMVPLSLLMTVLLMGRFEAAPHRAAAVAASDGPAPLFSRPTGAILVLVALSLSALVLEGAGFDWSAIFMRDVFQAAPWVGAAAVAIGAFTQAVTRYLADRHVERHSPMKVARLMLTLLGLGNVLVVTAAHPAQALIGFGLMGVGTSVLFPLAMSAAAQRTDRSAAVNVAALAQIAFVSFMLAPPLLGFVAEHIGIRWSFGLGLPMVLLSLAVSGVLRQRPVAQPAAATTQGA
ncbi:MFS transporter [Leptothrix discophora]|uniref:MFS transporter n=1 Tax=Leptothrix discophora TaxID=89 RepID=A0ABT9G5F0_LEPDI|nr:MFS transporter [Leptothrix discophora]MDP4301720.1 MFS transporter [Leptothrix discophora]